VADVNELVATAYGAEREGRWKEAAALWREVVWCSPDHEDRGAFCANYGRAILECGEKVRAVNLLSRLAKLYPDRAECLSSLALAYSRSDAHDRSGPVWAEVLSKFPGNADRRWWLPSAAHSWLELGQLDQAEQACREAMSEFPESPWGFAMLSVVAERRFQWELALDMVGRALAVCSARERIGLVVSKLRVLSEMGNVGAVKAILEEELGRDPGNAPLLIAASYSAVIQGPMSEAKERWESCVSTCPDAQDAYIGKASFLRDTGHADEAEDILRHCCERWPEQPSLWRALAETCAYRRKMECAEQAWVEASRIAPISIFGLWGQSAFLGSCGAREEAEDLLASREAAGSVLWRGRYEYAKAARELDAAIACLEELRKTSPGVASLAHAEAEVKSWRQADGDLETAAHILRAQLDVSPSSVRSAELLVRVLVLLGKADEAAALLAQIPPDDCRPGVLEARVWNDAVHADWRHAHDKWNGLTDRFFLPALHLPKANLRLLGGKLKRDAGKGVLVASMMRNELPRLPDFLAHHRRLGVSGFVLIDNDSKDGTLDYLVAQPDVLVYSTADSYSQSYFGIRWLNQVIDMHGSGWVLYADADERLVYSGSEKRSVNDLTQYLSRRGEQIVPGVMIDMFPRRFARGGALKHDWFDPLRIRPSLMSPFIEAAGGARRRLFGTSVTISKAPLINAGAGVRYLSSHTTTPAPVSAIRAGLLHYHLDYLFEAANVERLKEEVARGEHSDFAVDRRRSLAMSLALAEGDLRGPDSQRYSGTDQLLRLGLISTTDEFEAQFG
jgi:predicted Zn-dependent protease